MCQYLHSAVLAKVSLITNYFSHQISGKFLVSDEGQWTSTHHHGNPIAKENGRLGFVNREQLTVSLQLNIRHQDFCEEVTVLGYVLSVCYKRLFKGYTNPSPNPTSNL